jgi:hypothetical protein
MKTTEITQKDIDSIVYNENRPNLKTQGNTDPDGFQIFTPQFIVKGMVKLIDSKIINDLNKTILEPTSGDGAFTCFILQTRLKSLNIRINILAQILRSIATIYSIEMDEYLVKEQRNNLFSIIIKFLKEKDIIFSDDFIEKVKRILLSNVIWGQTNIDNTIKFADDVLGWYIKNNNAIKNSKNKIQFTKWFIDNNLNIEYKLEDVESNGEIDTKHLGGLFGD